MMRCTLVLLLFLTAVACKKGTVAPEIQEPLNLNVADEIAYIAKLKTANAFQLFLMKTDGSALRTLSGDSISNEPLAVSHDGNKFLFSTYDQNKTAGLYAIDKRGGGPVLLASGLNPYTAMTWSPDDTKILFLKWTLGMTIASDVFVIDRDGKNEKQLTTDGRNLYPHWFPDGRKIIYSSAGINPGIYVMTADWSGSWRIGLGGASNVNAVVSPGGDKVTFAIHDQDRSLLYVMNADGTGTKLAVVAPGASVPAASSFYKVVDLSPAWSPDGTKIAYACRVGDNSEIFVVNPDGSENKRLTNTNKLESNPIWSKDGRHIVYLANDPEVYNPAIYIMRANGHSPTQVSKTDGYIMYPTYIAQ